MMRHTVEIAAGAEELFRLTQDYGRRLEWDQFLASAVLLEDAEAAGVGVRALCVANNGFAMETEYVSFRPPFLAAVKMTRGPWFIRRFAGVWRFESIGDSRTRVVFQYRIDGGPRCLSWLVTPFLVGIFSHATRRRLAGLKAYVAGNALRSSAP